MPLGQYRLKRAKANTSKGLELAIKAVGTRYRLALLLGLTTTATQHWWRIPAERVVQVEKVTGVDRTKLRPDLYER
jgi:DNA-binding transcriptional regulator YdaS (Cro superfamily)